jgi:hypothetical protein
MQLHQIKIEFNAEHDRLLMSVSTSDGQEIRLWLTRRCVKLLWPLLIKMVESHARVQLQGATPEARAALVGMEHEKAVQKADFSQPYATESKSHPLGAEPLLVARMQTRRDDAGGHLLTLLPLSGQGINLAMDDGLLHSCCRLLQQAAVKADWDIRLDFPQSTLPPAETERQRTLN